MKKYRLKKEAVPFFLEKHATCIYSFDTWESLQVNINALEEIKEPFISFGIENLLNGRGSSLCGWNDKGSHYHFTINFPSMKHMEHDKFKKGESIRELMDKIQEVSDYFFQDFVNDELDND